MSKIVLVLVNVGFFSNAQARQKIKEMSDKGYGIDKMAEDPNKDTWITFYKYEK